MPQQQSASSAKIRTRADIEEPGYYEVYLHNDDITTFDFVVFLLTSLFRLSEGESVGLAFLVDEEGKALVKVYRSLDIARAIVNKAHKAARAAGFPLRFTIEHTKASDLDF